MADATRGQKFLDSEEADLIRQDLIKMMKDRSFNTKATYSPAAIDGETMLFVDKHMNYLSKHANLAPDQYLSNLRLMTRVR